ncbi:MULTISPECIES: rhamnan synthesis F family protein [unclassified Fibrobacter]|uniref:rhamnan synthesis F family protein n=1 Tax=unclassified Fibrobacter TaxID=2634177 RepID=UPI000D7B300A|nr:MULTISPECIES: rhamnan synthesis F family protein [unclassified Fibrobacter]PWJ68108.1 rhamnan synthesis protein F [Fibrobacter sp. UWR4]PZW71843.1 rhamnan synthesis protein F [Fibrobacter sp. UWR1]
MIQQVHQVTKLILYASYQTGETLPGYVQFALTHLAETDFKVVLLTNRRELSKETVNFLKEKNIDLYLTENHGFDFGMWRRYLKDKAPTGMQSLERLLLINDSMVYYQNKFDEYFRRAEASPADAISLTENTEVRRHLQSYFLYLKQPALGAFFLHMMETPEQETFYDVVHKLEIGLANTFDEAEVRMEALYHTEAPVMFAYPELIAQGAGFVKRKLLQSRFNFKEKVHFIRRGAYDSLNANYAKLILDAGVASDFDPDWLPRSVDGNIKRAADKLWEKPFQKVGWPILRTAIKTKYKLLRKNLDGDEYK